MSSIDGTLMMVDDQLSGAGNYINGAAQQIADELAAPDQAAPAARRDLDRSRGVVLRSAHGRVERRRHGLFGAADQGGVLGEIAAAMNVSWNNYSEAEVANVSTWSSSG
jgi:hypothetical protein